MAVFGALLAQLFLASHASAIPPLIGGGNQSGACTAPTATVVDGFVGSLYAKLLVQRNSSDTWVCARLQQESQPEIAGGRFIVTDPDALTDVDSNYSACDVIRSGAIGDPSDPPTYVPYFIGSYSDASNNAWVCLKAGAVEERVMFNGGLLTPLLQDDPAAVPNPVRTPWTVGVASADCESKPGVTRLLNLMVGDTQIWADAWQSGSIAELCARGESGSNDGGVRVTVDATGSPGVTPVFTPSSNLAPCASGLNVFHDDQDQIDIRRSPTRANPTSICIGIGANQQSFTIGTVGSPQEPTVTPVTDS